jgi:Tfp pilus assembly ATPase PilU
VNLEELLKLMMDLDASDIYITAGLPPIFRVEGKTKPMSDGEALSPEDTKRLSSIYWAFQGEYILPNELYRSCYSPVKNSDSVL